MRLVILRTARYDDDAEEVDLGEISVFLAPTFVITVRQGVASELREARQRLEQRPELLAAGSASALWAILDQVVDGYAPVVAGLERDIDQIEATVFSGAVAPTERIYSLRREATGFYRAVHPLLGVVAAVERGAAPELQPYLRDVHDHLLLVNEEVAAQRDLLGTVLEASMAVISVEQTKVSVRQNATIEQLTILATVFLPLTFVTGFFGQIRRGTARTYPAQASAKRAHPRHNTRQCRVPRACSIRDGRESLRRRRGSNVVDGKRRRGRGRRGRRAARWRQIWHASGC